MINYARQIYEDEESDSEGETESQTHSVIQCL